MNALNVGTDDIQGLLELIDKTHVSGWVLGGRETQPSIFLYFDGRLIKTIRTNVQRPDVSVRFDTKTTLLGFDVDIAPDLERYSQIIRLDSRHKGIEVSVSSTGKGIAHLIGSPFLVLPKQAISRVKIANIGNQSIILVGNVQIEQALNALSTCTDVVLTISPYLTLQVSNGGISTSITTIAGEKMVTARIALTIHDQSLALEGLLSASLHVEQGGQIPCVLQSASSQQSLEIEVERVDLVSTLFLAYAADISLVDNYLYWFDYFRSQSRIAEISHLASLCPVQHTLNHDVIEKYAYIWDFLWEAGLWAAFETYAKKIQPLITDAIRRGAVPCIDLILRNALNTVRCLCDFNYSKQPQSVIDASRQLFLDIANFTLHSNMLNEAKATWFIKQFKSLSQSSLRTVVLSNCNFRNEFVALVVRSIAFTSTRGGSSNIEAIPPSNAQILAVFVGIDDVLHAIKRQWPKGSYDEILEGFRAACSKNKLLAYAIGRAGSVDEQVDIEQFLSHERAVYAAMGYSARASFCPHSLLTYLRRASSISTSWMAEYKNAIAARSGLYTFSPRYTPTQMIHMAKPDKNLSVVLDQIGDDLFPLLSNEHDEDLTKTSHIVFDYVDLHHSHTLGKVLLDLIAKIDNKQKCILFFTPWVSLGGADALCCIIANHLASSIPVYLCLTEDGNNDGIEKLSNKVKVIHMNPSLKDLDMETREYLTAMMIEIANPAAVVNLNSRLAWNVLDKYGARVAHSRAYIAFFFCDDVDPTGDKVSYLRAFARSSDRPNVHLISDSVNYFGSVIEELGLKQSAHHGVLFPVQDRTISLAAKKSYSTTSRVLWCGRFDRQKRLDIALAIAKICPHLTFHFYGFPLLNSYSSIVEELRALHNVRFNGRYSDFTSIDIDSYDALLLTSQWEGTPNIALECGARRLPIVAPCVGGLIELIGEERGFLVEKFDDVLGFRDALQLCCEDRALAKLRSENLFNYIRDYHRQDRVEKVISTIINQGAV